MMIHRIVKIVARIPSYREYEKSVKLKVSEPQYANKVLIWFSYALLIKLYSTPFNREAEKHW